MNRLTYLFKHYSLFQKSKEYPIRYWSDTIWVFLAFVYLFLGFAVSVKSITLFGLNAINMKKQNKEESRFCCGIMVFLYYCM